MTLTVDSGLVTLYWHIGRRVHQDILKAHAVLEALEPQVSLPLRAHI
jgi:hypothetical protein